VAMYSMRNVSPEMEKSTAKLTFTGDLVPNAVDVEWE